MGAAPSHSTNVGSVLIPGGLGLVCGGKQEDALWFLWCAACQEAEEELCFCPSSSSTDTAKNNHENPNIHYKKLPACGFSSEAELPLGCGDLRSHAELCWLSLLLCHHFQPRGVVLSAAPLIVPGGTSKALEEPKAGVAPCWSPGG